MKSLRYLFPILLIFVSLLISCNKEEDPAKPTASFTTTKADYNTGEAIVFTNTSADATAFVWSFGDATTSTEKSPTKTYNTAGVYVVTMTATGPGGSASATKQLTITVAESNKDLYFIEYSANKIKKVSLKSGSVASDYLDITGKAGVGIAYDAVNNKVYFSDFEAADEGKIWRMNFDGTGLQAIVSGITDPYSIAINNASGKIYWSDDNGNISRANLDGTGVETSFINVTDGQMRAIAFDSKNNKIYFYEVNGENLYVANADGTNVSVLIAGVYGYGLYVDEVNNKLYFEDKNASALKIANLDGSNPAIVTATGSTRIFGIDVDHEFNKVYWSDRDLGEIKKANLDGTSPETVLSGLGSPRGFFIK